MKDLSLWDEILFTLRFNDSTSHNIFLIAAILLAFAFIGVVFIYILFRILDYNKDGNKSKGRGKIILAMLGFWMLIFPWGIFLLSEISLTRDSTVAAMNKAFIYELGGKKVAAMIVEKFQSSGNDNGIMYGDTFYKIQSIDLESGKLLFDEKLKDSTNASGDVKILGDSKESLLLFYNSQIIAIDKETGKTTHSINSVTNQKNVKLLPSSQMCKFDNLTQSIIFKANNGLVYSLDTKSFNMSEKATIDADKYFGNDDKESPDKNLGTGILIDNALDKDSYNMFLTESDINKLKEGLKISSSSENTERRFLYNGNLDNLKELKKISQEVFLSGGFLLTENKNNKPFYSSIDTTNKNFQNYVNIVYRGQSSGVEPFRVDGSNLSFIVHKKTLDSGTNILLTAIDLQSGKTAWTIDTGAYEIHECYAVDKNHILLFCQSESGLTSGFYSNYVLYISLKEGTCTGFNLKYGKSFTLRALH